jgi:uncharacterized protein with FMN-binding domain
VEMKVTVADGEIREIEVVRHKEDRFFTAFTDVPARLIEHQGLNGVDTITGATITSEAVTNAVGKALVDGMK